MMKTWVRGALMGVLLLASAAVARAQVCSVVANAGPTPLAQGATLNASWLGFGCLSFTGYRIDLAPDPLGLNPILTGGAGPGEVHTAWPVQECLPTGTYYLHITQGTAGGQTGANTNNVTVTMGPVPCVYWAKAGGGGGGINMVEVDQGATLPITWSSQNQHHFTLHLHRHATGLPFNTTPFGGDASGTFFAATSAAQAANFTATANLSPLQSIPPDRYRVRVVVYKADGTSRELFTNPFDVTPTLAVGNATVTPSAVQAGGSISIGWGQRNQASYRVSIDGTVIVPRTNGTTTTAPWAVPADTTPGSHTATVTVWDAANHSSSAAASFSVQRASVAWTASAASIPETVGSVTLTARLTTSNGAPTSLPVMASWTTANGTAVAGQDYGAASGTLTFAAGSASGSTRTTTPVSVIDDVLDEPDETFSLSLGTVSPGVVGSPASVAVTITDNDPPVTFTVGDAQVVETNAGTPALAFYVYRSPSTPATVTVAFSTANGTAGASDYIPRSGVLTFGAGDTSQPLPVSVVADTIYEGNETLTLNLSSPTGGVIGDGQGLGTIVDDDAQPAITIGDVSLAEGNAGTSAASFAVTLSNQSQFPVTVAYATADGQALAPSDYSPVAGVLTIAPLTSTGTVSVPVVGNVAYERAEDFFVNLSAPTGGTVADGQGRATITNDDAPPTLNVGDATATEGNGGSTPLTLVVSLSGPTEVPVTVTCSTSNGTALAGADFQATTQSLSFPVGTVTRDCTIPVLGEALSEGDEVFTGVLSAPADATVADGSGLARILDDDRTDNPAPRADFNADGKTDLLFRHQVSGNYVLWFMDGLFRSTGSLLTPPQPAAGNWRVVGAADYDHGIPGADLLWQNVDSGNLALWMMNGTTQTTGAVVVGMGVDWKVAATADFDADGKFDYLWRSSATGDLRVWFMDGATKLGEATPTPAGLAGLNWTLGGLGDLNDDGFADLVWHNQTSGVVVAWRMNGLVRIDGVVVGTMDPAWRVVGIWDADFDGHDDLVWQHGTTGALFVWLMNGTTIVHGSALSPEKPADLNWKAVGPR